MSEFGPLPAPAHYSVTVKCGDDLVWSGGSYTAEQFQRALCWFADTQLPHLPSPEREQDAMCVCGHTLRWHADGDGSCEHDGECRCVEFTDPGGFPAHARVRGRPSPEQCRSVDPCDRDDCCQFRERFASAGEDPDHGSEDRDG